MDLATDLRMLLDVTVTVATHPQMFLIAFKLLGTRYGPPGQVQFVGNQELKGINGLFDFMFTETGCFSQRYLYMKYLLRKQ